MRFIDEEKSGYYFTFNSMYSFKKKIFFFISNFGSYLRPSFLANNRCSYSILRRLSTSRIAFSMAFFWIKAHASSTLSLAITVTVVSMASVCCGVKFRPKVTIKCFKWFLIDWSKWSRQVIMAIPEVKLRTMLCAADLIRFSSGSKE